MKRLSIFILFYALLNGFAAHDVMMRSPWAHTHPCIAWTIALLFLALQLVGPIGDRRGFARLRANKTYGGFIMALSWASYVAFGLFFSLVVYLLLADIFTVGWFFIHRPADIAAYNHNILLIVLGALALNGIAGIISVLRGPVIKRVTVKLPNLPQGFDGFRIAQISDIHIGPTIGRRYTSHVVDVVNSLKPDLIALTGDVADGRVIDLQNETAPLGTLVAPFGKFYVTGNHEYYWGGQDWSAEMRRLGFHVFANQHVVIERGGANLVLAGVNDWSTRHWNNDQATSPARAAAGAPAGLVKILLAHQPPSYREAQANGFDLQLSGHTHAGQYFPFTLLIYFFQRFPRGLRRYKSLQIYVNRGAGHWGPPLRCGARAEVTELTLRAQ